MPRMHEREQPTEMAKAALTLAIYDELRKHDLTEAEWLRVVHGAYDSVISGFVKQQIRLERHGDIDTPGGWAAEPSTPDGGA